MSKRTHWVCLDTLTAVTFMLLLLLLCLLLQRPCRRRIDPTSLLQVGTTIVLVDARTLFRPFWLLLLWTWRLRWSEIQRRYLATPRSMRHAWRVWSRLLPSALILIVRHTSNNGEEIRFRYKARTLLVIVMTTINWVDVDCFSHKEVSAMVGAGKSSEVWCGRYRHNPLRYGCAQGCVQEGVRFYPAHIGVVKWEVE